MKTTRKTFVFNTVWYEIIKDCSAQVKGEVFASVMEYALNGTMPTDISNEANVIFQFIKIEIDRREKRRQRTLTAKSPSEASEISESSEKSDYSEYSELSEKPLPPLTRQQRRLIDRQAAKLRKKCA